MFPIYPLAVGLERRVPESVSYDDQNHLKLKAEHKKLFAFYFTTQ